MDKIELDFIKTGGYRTRDSIIHDLKSDNLPVVIFGTGRFGKAVAETIIANDISVLCFLDKEEYWAFGKTLTICGKSIRCLNRTQLLQESKQYNILLGIIDYSLLHALRKEFKECHYVEYLDVYFPHIMSKAFLVENRKTINEIYLNLGDAESQEVLKAYLHARYTGDVRALSSLIHNPDFLYDWELLSLSKQDVVVDGGAYIGDTIIEMRNFIGELPKRVFAFEPDKNNIERLYQNFSKKEQEHISAITAGLYSRDDILHFVFSGTVGSTISDSAKETIYTQALDEHDEYKNITVIKMDIEGSELEALYGCKKLLYKNKPRLAICIYHKNEDLIDIYNFLKEFKYRFYLRHHSASVEETVLYAI